MRNCTKQGPLSPEILMAMYLKYHIISHFCLGVKRYRKYLSSAVMLVHIPMLPMLMSVNLDD